MKSDAPIHDAIGIGFGPANVALAIALEESGAPLDVLFLESRTQFAWQPGMLFPNADIQNHPLRDLVTPRNPRSRYTFVNFLFEHGRLFEHLNVGLAFPLRIEYAQYVAWVASHFSHQVKYGRRVVGCAMQPSVAGSPCYEVECANGERYRAHALVIAPGRTPYIPPPFDRLQSPRVAHLNNYLSSVEALGPKMQHARVAVIGGSQSAVEILLHLSENFPQAQIFGITRRFGYRLKDTSPFMGEVYFPEFVDLFYAADPDTRAQLARDLRPTNYSAADSDVLNQLYQRIYTQKLVGQQRLFVWRSARVLSARSSGDSIRMDIERIEPEQGVQTEDFDLVILATGFRDLGSNEHQEPYPRLLEALVPWIDLCRKGCVQIGRNYELRMKAGAPKIPIYLNGLCESSHGMGDAGSFSLLSLRAQTIVDGLVGLRVSPTRTRLREKPPRDHQVAAYT